MANLLIICDNKRQARNLFRRTVNHRKQLGRTITFHNMNFYVTDHDSGDQARFATLYEINKKHIDDGFHATRIEGYAFERALDVQEVKIFKEENNNDM